MLPVTPRASAKWTARIERASPEWRPGALPAELRPRSDTPGWSRTSGRCRRRAALCPLSYGRDVEEPPAGVEPAPRPYKGRVLAVDTTEARPVEPNPVGNQVIRVLVNSPRSVSILVLAAAAATVVTSASTARAPGTAASGQHRLRVVLHAGYPIPELGDTGNVVEDRAWLGTVDATATAAVRCVDLKLTVSQLISGVYGPAPVGVASQETVTRHLSARGEYGAYAHQRVPLLAEAFCRRPSGQTLRASVKTTVLIDVPPCTGSLRVLAGKATVNGRTVTQGTRIARGAITSVPRRGRLVLGAPECNGFRVVLPPGVARIGGYSPKARGAPFVSNRLVGIRADGHAGGARAASLPVLVRPNGIDCADCALPLPASFALQCRSVSRCGTRLLWDRFGGHA